MNSSTEASCDNIIEFISLGDMAAAAIALDGLERGELYRVCKQKILGKIYRKIKDGEFSSARYWMHALETLYLNWPWTHYGVLSESLNNSHGKHSDFELFHSVNSLSKKYDVESRYIYGTLLMRAKKFPEAIKVLRDVYEQSDHRLAGSFLYYDLGWAAYASNNYVIMEEVFEKLLSVVVDDDLIFSFSFELLCKRFIEIGYFWRIDDLIKLHRSMWGHSAVMLIYWGLLEIQKGNTVIGYGYLAEARCVRQIITPNSGGYSTLLPPEKMIEFDSPNKNPHKCYPMTSMSSKSIEWSMNNLPTKDDNVVLVTSCDKIYFRNMFELYMDGASIFNNDKILHVHLIDPDAEDIDRLMHYSQHSQPMRLNFSIDMSNIGSRAYYASSRFMYARELISRYDCSICITDIDIVVGCDISFVDEFIGGNPIGLPFSACSLPWQKYVANFLFLRNDTMTDRFLGLLEKSLSEFFFGRNLHGLDMWWVDQSAIYSTIEYLKDIDPYFLPVNLGSVYSEIIYSGANGSDVLEWLGGTKAELMKCNIGHLRSSLFNGKISYNNLNIDFVNHHNVTHHKYVANLLIRRLIESGATRVILYGAGEIGRSVINEMKMLNIKCLCIVDRNYKYINKSGLCAPLVSLEDSLNFNADIIVIASKAFSGEIAKNIQDIYDAAGRDIRIIAAEDGLCI